MLSFAKWIATAEAFGSVAPVFETTLTFSKPIQKAALSLTSVGVYVAEINGKRVGEYVLAPGWTAYQKRLQVQTYDVTDLLEQTSTLAVTVAKGWQLSHLAWYDHHPYYPADYALIGELHVQYTDGSEDVFATDESWSCRRSALLDCEIYDGELYDARMTDTPRLPVRVLDKTKDILIPQEGEEIREMLTLTPKAFLTTPKGEKVIDFGQNLTGYVSFSLNAKAGDTVKIRHFEILDREGNVYTENYRSAKATLSYICRDGLQSYKPTHTFYGFRYIVIDEFPGEIDPDAFLAIAVHSNMKKTSSCVTSDPRVNRLIENIEWGQRGNFLDIPTDCPQRDERLGWTGDAQVFCRIATYQFDTERFFKKWFGDMRAEQWENGGIPHVIPFIIFQDKHCSAAWGDAGVICPWQVYLTYGNKEILEKQFESMKGRINYISVCTKDEYLWTGCQHFGDWCALDLGKETTDSASRKDFIASVYYANAARLVAKAGKALGKDVSYYLELEKKIIDKINLTFPTYHTQCEHALALYFDITPNKAEVAAALADMVVKNGIHLDTGFVGTPYLLHALSENGYLELAYSLLLQDTYPSWLFSVKQGATTIWEHWDGIKEDGTVWSAGMNSYNHYAYGAVGDWIYGVAAGIRTVEDAPGFAKVEIAPHPDKRLTYLTATLDTRHGKVLSHWERFEDGWRYEIETPVEATVTVGGKTKTVPKGRYLFYSK
ncbi:MAG: family 78 glycoside hydrolase catalytic domain [Clostridia bacterium]|nr:family 78 glycoside hydrolase catalytic domain [Clostridia bacterium]